MHIINITGRTYRQDNTIKTFWSSMYIRQSPKTPAFRNFLYFGWEEKVAEQTPQRHNCL